MDRRKIPDKSEWILCLSCNQKKPPHCFTRRHEIEPSQTCNVCNTIEMAKYRKQPNASKQAQAAKWFANNGLDNSRRFEHHFNDNWRNNGYD